MDFKMSTSTSALMTAEELLRLQSGQHRYELINGELKTMSPAGHTGRIALEGNELLPGFSIPLSDIFGIS